MATISQRLGWSAQTVVTVAPTSVRAQGTAFRLTGHGLTINGKSAKNATVPVGDAEAAFRKAIIGGQRAVTITRTTRGRPSKATTVDGLAAALRQSAPKRERKPRQNASTPEPTTEAPSA
jgi:hypothetical protein